jgi:oxygen-independent coproporphyrinogen-3 oxidase
MELTAECLAELSTTGPRYTSYPPATELRPIDDTAVTAELARIADERAPISLYVHIPFCRNLCAYCGCNVIPTRDASRGDRYVDTLATELALLAKALGPDMPVAEIAWGGGSPNFLEPQAMRQLVTAIGRYFWVGKHARMSVELDPRTTTSSQIETLASLGFRSMSVGVQDFSQAVQNAIRRHQSVSQTHWLVDRARAAGFGDINIDVVYGLPHQTEDSFATTLKTVADLGPDRIALFGYAHLPDKLPHQRIVERSGRILDRYERATLLLLAVDQLTKAGYVHLGLDHFARRDSLLSRAATEHRMTRTFQGYVEHRADTILGVGTSAISTTPRMFWQNHSTLGPWQQAIEAGRLPIARGVTLDADDRLRRAVIERLMCDGEVALGELCRRHHVDAPSYFAAELDRVGAMSELASYDAESATVRTTSIGRLLVRNVCMAFDRYHHTATPSRFSSTI